MLANLLMRFVFRCEVLVARPFSPAHQQQEGRSGQWEHWICDYDKAIAEEGHSATPLVNIGKYGCNIGQETVVVLLQRPVDKCGATDNILFGHKAPISRVGTPPAIITQDEVFVGRHDHVVNIFVVVDVPLIVGINIGLVQDYMIYYDGGILNGDGIPGYANNALDIVLRRLRGSDKDDHVTTSGWTEKVGPFIDEDEFLVMQAGFHTGAFDIEVLDGKADD